ncbi:hypothetical protein ABIA39_007463 [Nocardia sp. GAS34]|uniref:hypothetical protein n=1 Tax=unclassified Nocardia TaxID=2637762 RepID=UPI003D1CF4F5
MARQQCLQCPLTTLGEEGATEADLMLLSGHEDRRAAATPSAAALAERLNRAADLRRGRTR